MPLLLRGGGGERLLNIVSYPRETLQERKLPLSGGGRGIGSRREIGGGGKSRIRDV